MVHSTPIFKTGKKQDLWNYRPVSLIAADRNVIEQSLLEAIFSRVRDREEAVNSQCRFIKGKSYPTNLTTFCDETTSLVDKVRAVGVVHLDFMKVFDTDSPSNLTAKLVRYVLESGR